MGNNQGQPEQQEIAQNVAGLIQRRGRLNEAEYKKPPEAVIVSESDSQTLKIVSSKTLSKMINNNKCIITFVKQSRSWLYVSVNRQMTPALSDKKKFIICFLVQKSRPSNIKLITGMESFRVDKNSLAHASGRSDFTMASKSMKTIGRYIAPNSYSYSSSYGAGNRSFVPLFDTRMKINFFLVTKGRSSSRNYNQKFGKFIKIFRSDYSDQKSFYLFEPMRKKVVKRRRIVEHDNALQRSEFYDKGLFLNKFLEVQKAREMDFFGIQDQFGKTVFLNKKGYYFFTTKEKNYNHLSERILEFRVQEKFCFIPDLFKESSLTAGKVGKEEFDKLSYFNFSGELKCFVLKTVVRFDQENPEDDVVDYKFRFYAVSSELKINFLMELEVSGLHSATSIFHSFSDNGRIFEVSVRGLSCCSTFYKIEILENSEAGEVGYKGKLTEICKTECKDFAHNFKFYEVAENGETLVLYRVTETAIELAKVDMKNLGKKEKPLTEAANEGEEDAGPKDDENDQELIKD